MSIAIQEIRRVFRYNGISLPDVPGLEPREVRDLYSAQYPELVSAEVEAGEVRDGTQEFTFRKAVGTKGASLREGSRRAAVRRRADAEAQGLGGVATVLGGALAHRRTAACARVLSEVVQANLHVDRDDRDTARVAMPSGLLAPLP